MTSRIAAAQQEGSRWRTGWLALGLPAMLAACAQLPDWEGKATLPQPMPASLQATHNASHNIPYMDWPQQRWWQRYGDAQLNELIDQALQGAPDMAAAAARVQQAKAMLGVSESASAPQVSARVSATEDKLSYNHLTPEAFTPRGSRRAGRARGRCRAGALVTVQQCSNGLCAAAAAGGQ